MNTSTQEPTVRSWMATELVSVAPDDSAGSAFEAMGWDGVRHVLVRTGGDGALLGIISNRDLCRIALHNSGRILDFEGCTAADVMTPMPLAVIGPDALLTEAAQMMTAELVNALPVLDGDDLAGVITSADLLRSLWQSTNPKPVSEGDSAA